MSEEKVPLTPAEQMRRIREVVNAMESEATSDASREAYTVLTNSFSRLETLRQRIVDLESKMLLKEQPFVSHAPVIGPLIVYFRSVWNWMSTKWYAVPLIKQQNDFNMAVSQTLRELTMSVESVAQLVQDTQMRVAEMEATICAQVAGEQERR